MKSRRNLIAVLAVAALLIVVAGCQALVPAEQAQPAAAGEAGKLVVYSGRSENLVAPLIEQFEQASGIDVEVRYGSTSEMAATILEEGSNSPADVFFSQDAGALGALSNEARLAALPEDVLNLVDARYRSPKGEWVGVSGRARVLVFNTETVADEELPTDVHALADPKWSGRVGWAPTNASFQSFVTAMRLLEGEEQTRAWLEGMIANNVQTYDRNDAIVAAVGAGEIDLGLVNHYYLYQFLKEQGESFPARNYHLPSQGAGSIVNIAGAAILNTAPHQTAAEELVRYLLAPDAQAYFATETNEYPLAAGVEVDPRLKPLSEIAVPDLDLSNLADLQGTLELLQEVGALQ